jgi:hypothetical protein
MIANGVDAVAAEAHAPRLPLTGLRCSEGSAREESEIGHHRITDGLVTERLDCS